MTNEDLKHDFQKDEFRYLTGEIRAHVDEQFKLERYAVVGIVSVYAWLLTREHLPETLDSIIKYAFWLPPGIVLFSILRIGSLYFTLEGIYAYIKKIEHKHLGPLGGWQHFVVSQRKEKWGASLFRGSMLLFWLVLLAVTTAIGWHFAPLV